MGKALIWIVFLLCPGGLYSQPLKIDAGRQAVYCQAGLEIGTAGATGGTRPYSYKWSLSNGTPLDVYLNDITRPNPTLRGQPAGIDSAYFIITATDSTGSIARDSVMVRFSSWNYSMQDCLRTKGDRDTVKLFTPVASAWMPLKYQWEPASQLSKADSPTPKCWAGKSIGYTATVTNRLGCVVTSNCSVTVIPSVVPDIHGYGVDIKIYPKAVTNVSVMKLTPALVGGDIVVFAADRRLLFKGRLMRDTFDIGAVLSGLDGVYFYTYIKGNSIYNGKVVHMLN